MNSYRGWMKRSIRPPAYLLPRKTFDMQKNGCISEAWSCPNSLQKANLSWHSKLCDISEMKPITDFVFACPMGILSSWRGWFCLSPSLIFTQFGSSFSPHVENQLKSAETQTESVIQLHSWDIKIRYYRWGDGTHLSWRKIGSSEQLQYVWPSNPQWLLQPQSKDLKEQLLSGKCLQITQRLVTTH